MAMIYDISIYFIKFILLLILNKPRDKTMDNKKMYNDDN